MHWQQFWYRMTEDLSCPDGINSVQAQLIDPCPSGFRPYRQIVARTDSHLFKSANHASSADTKALIRGLIAGPFGFGPSLCQWIGKTAGSVFVPYNFYLYKLGARAAP